MGGLLVELFWILGGDEKKALNCLERAVEGDGTYTKARILAAKGYKTQGRIDEAKKQVETEIRVDKPHYRYAWEHRCKPESRRLLLELPPAGAFRP